MSRFAIAGLRLLASAAAGAAAWTTLWIVRGGEPGPIAYVASLAATLAVYVASTSPPPRSWDVPPPEPEEPAATQSATPSGPLK